MTLALMNEIALSLISLYGYISEKEDLDSLRVSMVQF